jgi:hypothetical protein
MMQRHGECLSGLVSIEFLTADVVSWTRWMLALIESPTTIGEVASHFECADLRFPILLFWAT